MRRVSEGQDVSEIQLLLSDVIVTLVRGCCDTNSICDCPTGDVTGHSRCDMARARKLS